MTQTAQEIIDEVEYNSPHQSEGERNADDGSSSSGDANGLFVIPQEELTKISWEELKKVSQ